MLVLRAEDGMTADPDALAAVGDQVTLTIGCNEIVLVVTAVSADGEEVHVGLAKERMNG